MFARQMVKRPESVTVFVNLLERTEMTQERLLAYHVVLHGPGCQGGPTHVSWLHLQQWMRAGGSDRALDIIRAFRGERRDQGFAPDHKGLRLLADSAIEPLYVRAAVAVGMRTPEHIHAHWTAGVPVEYLSASQ